MKFRIIATFEVEQMTSGEVNKVLHAEIARVCDTHGLELKCSTHSEPKAKNPFSPQEYAEAYCWYSFELSREVTHHCTYHYLAQIVEGECGILSNDPRILSHSVYLADE